MVLNDQNLVNCFIAIELSTGCKPFSKLEPLKFDLNEVSDWIPVVSCRLCISVKEDIRSIKLETMQLIYQEAGAETKKDSNTEDAWI